MATPEQCTPATVIVLRLGSDVMPPMRTLHSGPSLPATTTPVRGLIHHLPAGDRAEQVHPWPGDPDRRQAARLAHVIVDTLAGRRHPDQLIRWLEDDPLVVLEDRRRIALSPGLRLASVRVQFPSRTTAEVSMRMALRDRSIAGAFRLERLDTRWLCVDLILGPVPAPIHLGIVPRQTVVRPERRAA